MRTRDEKTAASNRSMFEIGLAKVQIGRRNRDKEMIEEGMKEMNAAAKDEVTPGGDLPSTGETGGSLEGNHVHIHMPGNVGNGKSAEVTDAGEAGGAAAAPAAGAAEGGDANARLSTLEAGMKQIAATLAKLVGGGGGDEGEGGGDPTGDDMEDGDEVAGEKTGDEDSRIDLDDPHPAATGNKGENRVADSARTRARDSKHLQETFQQVVAKAEILSPGVPVPTFDGRKQAVFTLDSMCKLRRRSLERAWRTEDGKATIQTLYEGRDLPTAMSKMTCDSVKTLFNGASELVRTSNNEGSRGTGRAARTGDTAPVTTKSINDKNREFWSDPTKR